MKEISGQIFKSRAVARLLPPESAAAEVVAREVGIEVGTLNRWREDARSMPARGRAWSGAARLQAVITTAAMPEAGKSAWCREQGVYRRGSLVLAGLSYPSPAWRPHLPPSPAHHDRPSAVLKKDRCTSG